MEPLSCEQLLNEAARLTGPLHVTDLLTLPDALRQFLLWMVRQGEVGPADVAHHLGHTEADATALLATLAERGLATAADGQPPRYRAGLKAGRRPFGGNLPQI